MVQFIGKKIVVNRYVGINLQQLQNGIAKLKILRRVFKMKQ